MANPRLTWPFVGALRAVLAIAVIHVIVAAWLHPGFSPLTFATAVVVGFFTLALVARWRNQ